MKARNLLGFAGLVIAATLVTAFALNAVVGAPTASADGDRRQHKGTSLDYDSDVTQTCKVNIEFSEVKRSDVCDPDASVSQSGGHGGFRHRTDYDSDVTQKCRVNIEFSEVKDSDVCTPDADVSQGSGGHGGHASKKGPPSSNPTWDHDHDWDGKDGDHHDGHDGDDGHRHKSRVNVDIDNKEKTTCEAYGYLALNQCDVGGDANAFTEGDGGREWGGGGGWYGAGSYWEHRYKVGDVTITNAEKTTCEAEGIIALNQCDVDDDANAFTGVQGYASGLPLVGGLLG